MSIAARIEALEHVVEELCDRNGILWPPQARGLGRKSIRGENNGNAKLTEARISEARRLRAAGATYYALADLFHVSEATMRNALKGHTYGAGKTTPSAKNEAP